ncbi:MAG: Gfo/Idh/MocA family oxidoreductase [Magnetospirillum sp.]|nr:Gfo/Idh/MocA family oxidoreductase [Magnetospirillum sp.]
MVGIGLVGYGYWGPNLARNFSRRRDCRLVQICDRSTTRAELARQHYPNTSVTTEYEDLLNDPAVDAIIVATPVDAHFHLASQALDAGKDVLVEKPLTSTIAEAEALVALARRRGRILAVDHTFLFTGAVLRMRELVAAGELGDIIYMDSVRVNLGLFQHDVNVIWDLAPHDLSIFQYVCGTRPVAVRAMGHRTHSDLHESVAYVHLEYGGAAVAHCHVNWVSPVKLRLSMIAGTRKMIVFDDMEHSEKIKVYDKGISVRDIDRDTYNQVRVDYRTGDMWAPKLGMREALDLEAEEFIASVRDRHQPRVDGEFGLDIVRQLAACQRSIELGGERVEIA